jgi:hypothetical protein
MEAPIDTGKGKGNDSRSILDMFWSISRIEDVEW